MPPSPRSGTPSTPTARPSSPLRPTMRRNPDGDLVVPAMVGEVVLLPRLWGFEFDVDPEGGIRIENPSGLRAEAVRTADGAVRLSSMTDRPATDRPATRRPASRPMGPRPAIPTAS